MQEVHAVYTYSADATRSLDVTVRAYGTQRGGLAEHIEEAIESALRAAGAGAAGIAFDVGGDARLSDQLFRARRAGHDGISIRVNALRALCAPVGGLDASDARAIAFYANAANERPVMLVMDDEDRALPAFVIAKPLSSVIDAETESESESETETETETESAEPASVSLATVIAEAVAESAPEPVAVTETETDTDTETEPEPEAEFVWRPHADALDAARGPQTLASFERLFTLHYLPLADAIDRGFGARGAIAAREEFRRTFSRAYSEALPTFALTGKRPRMVLDAFDVASKMARAHNARSVQILLVDGMRFDLAANVCARAAEMLEGRAALADRITLFSALPSSTPRQLETLARGVDALRTAFDDREPEPLRDRTADTVRRVRIGSRDLYKLDLVETTLAAKGNDAVHATDDLADDAAIAIAKHARAQRARTLLFVMGDHGFRFDDGATKHGGASPEEVIVSGHAFLIGDLH